MSEKLEAVLNIMAFLILIFIALEVGGVFEPHLVGDKISVQNTITIDSCQYIFVSYSDHWGCLVHKGNCKNPIHAK